MFEDKTFENIMDEMLANVPEDIDTREGSVIYDAIAPIAMELAQVYIDIGLVLEECFADTASYYYLIKRCAERGIMVKEGTPAVLKVHCTPEDIQIENGTAFNIDEWNYSVAGSLGNGDYLLQCDESGTNGNTPTGDIIPVDDVEGLETIELVELYTPGTDDEEEESLRKRYFASFSESAFGGNCAAYREKADSMDGISGCKVVPAWNGGGTVKLVLLGSDYRAVKENVLESVQESIDPTKDGSGAGIAPIGHIVTVDTVKEVAVNVECTLVYVSGYTWDDVKDSFASAFESYLAQLRESWEEENNLTIRRGQIESILLGITGVDDVTDVQINNKCANYTLESDEVPIGGVYSG